MRLFLILTLLLFVSSDSGYCTTTYFPPLQPIGSGNNFIQDNLAESINPLNPIYNPVNSYPDIARIETTLFGRSFDGQSITLRLSRIERSLFTTTYPNSTYVQRIDNIISNFNQMNRYPNISTNILSGMEKKVLSQNFGQDNTQRRIERLEEQVFGAVQSGDVDSRYKALQIAVRNYNRNNILSPTTVANTGWKGILNNIGSSIMGGTMTGFTPPINPYYGNGYNSNNNLIPFASGNGIYQGYGISRGPFGYSYNDGFSNYGTGTGVTILD